MSEFLEPELGYVPTGFQRSEYMIELPRRRKDDFLRQVHAQKARERSERRQSDILEFLTVVSMGLDPTEQPLRRYIPVNVRIDYSLSGPRFDEAARFADDLRLELEEFLTVFGFSLEAPIRFETGSIVWRPRFYTTEKQTTAELEARLYRTEGALAAALALSRTSSSDPEPDREKRALELAHMRAETRNLDAETVETYLKAANKLIMLILSIPVAVGLTIGTLHLQKVVFSPDKQEIKIQHVSPKAAVSNHTAPVDSVNYTIEEEDDKE